MMGVKVELFEKTYPDCPSSCANFIRDDCKFKDVCKVQVDGQGGERIGNPTHYNYIGEWTLDACRKFCMECKDCTFDCPIKHLVCLEKGIGDKPADWYNKRDTPDCVSGLDKPDASLFNLQKIISAARMQVEYEKLFNGKKLTKKAICDLGVPFRDKYGLTDLQTLRIMRSEVTLSELLKILEVQNDLS